MFVSIACVMAKYIHQKRQDLLYEANSFYFESDYLKDISSAKSYTLAKGVDDILFHISNNIDDLRYSGVKIFYDISISDLDGNAVLDKNNESVGVIHAVLNHGGINSNEHVFSNLKDGTYVVSAVSTKPYVKALKANFIISNSNMMIDYQVTDAASSPILQLMIRTEDYQGNVKITWPSGVTPDNTHSLFSDVVSGYSSGSKVFSVQKHSEYIFQFFKENPDVVFQKSDFEVGGVS